MKYAVTIICLTVLITVNGANGQSIITEYPKSQVNFDDYEELVKEVKEVRAERLISLDEFLAFKKDRKTVILDTRSKDHYEAIHIKGAVNLPFTEFTTRNLRRLIPDTTTRILIYCNNNINGEPFHFASKSYSPNPNKKKSKRPKNKSMYIPSSTVNYNSKLISLALNVPTYINLYGYGYRNIYELNELVDITNKKVKFERRD